MKHTVDPALKTWATAHQIKVMDAIAEHGGQRAAARALGLHQGAVSTSMSRLKLLAASRGYAPDHDMVRPVPDPFVVKGVSTYYNKEGKAAGQWVKSRVDNDRLRAAILETATALGEELPRALPLPPPAAVSADLATVYTLTDCHIGMRAWREEGGADWNLEEAERVLVGCFRELVRASPPARIGIVNQLGDFLHSDSLAPLTPTSGHVLDQDGRYAQSVRVAVRVLRVVVAEALAKHERVILLVAPGNHDPVGATWMQSLFSALYELEPRIEVIQSELPYYAIQHGKTMLGFHHGHLKKNDALPLLFAAQFAPMWGATKKRYVHTGHRHHVEDKEHSGITVMQHPTLAARDAYAARGGWLSERQVRGVTYHASYGQVAMHSVVPEMLATGEPNA